MMQMQKRVPKPADGPADIEGGSSELDTMVVLPYSINIVHPEEPVIEGINPTPELEVVKKVPDEVKKDMLRELQKCSCRGF